METIESLAGECCKHEFHFFNNKRHTLSSAAAVDLVHPLTGIPPIETTDLPLRDYHIQFLFNRFAKELPFELRCIKLPSHVLTDGAQLFRYFVHELCSHLANIKVQVCTSLVKPLVPTAMKPNTVPKDPKISKLLKSKFPRDFGQGLGKRKLPSLNNSVRIDAKHCIAPQYINKREAKALRKIEKISTKKAAVIAQHLLDVNDFEMGSEASPIILEDDSSMQLHSEGLVTPKAKSIVDDNEVYMTADDTEEDPIELSRRIAHKLQMSSYGDPSTLIPQPPPSPLVFSEENLGLDLANDT